MIEEIYTYLPFGIWNEPDQYFKPEKYHGFVYRITNKSDGSFYIGKKVFRKKSGKDSDWRTYTGSSKTLTALIKEQGFDNFTFEILCLCENEHDLVIEERSLINKHKNLSEHLLINLN